MVAKKRRLKGRLKKYPKQGVRQDGAVDLYMGSPHVKVIVKAFNYGSGNGVLYLATKYKKSPDAIRFWLRRMGVYDVMRKRKDAKTPEQKRLIANARQRAYVRRVRGLPPVEEDDLHPGPIVIPEPAKPLKYGHLIDEPTRSVKSYAQIKADAAKRRAKDPAIVAHKARLAREFKARVKRRGKLSSSSDFEYGRGSYVVS